MSRLALLVVLLMLLLLGAFLFFGGDSPSPESDLEVSPPPEAATAPAAHRRRDLSSLPTSKDSRRSTHGPVTIDPEQAEPPAETLAAPRIIGRVVDAEGKPLVDVRVILMKSTMTSPSLLRRKVVFRGRCDGTGRFRIDDVPKGELIVILDRCDPTHVAGADRSLTVDAVQVYDLGDVVLGGKGHMSLSLRFLLPDGRPAAGQVVKINCYNMKKGSRSGVTNDAGEVTFNAWSPEDGFSLYAPPPEGCDRIYARLLPWSQRSNFEGLLEDDGWLPRSREFIRFFPGDAFFTTFRFKKKVVKKSVGTLVLHLPRLRGPLAYSYSAKSLDNPPWGRGRSLDGDPPYEVKLEQGRWLVHVTEFDLGDSTAPFVARRIARREIRLGERYDWTVEFDDVLWARGRVVRGGDPVPRVRWSQTREESVLPFLNFGRTDENGKFLIPLDPYSKVWKLDFTPDKGPTVHHTLHRKPLITDDEGRRILDIGDVSLHDGTSNR
ncbi:MAG TPA: carboxypeptidase regulatory-like domain-containing protein [Planctomycetes bacterium]|nr:carboxypeptidase regulatory-like domain-containing protein [Planctomycetota bacterium]